MKKLVFVLITALSVILTSCSWFNNDPVDPHIIGTGNVQYAAESNTWFVVIDSTQFIVSKITIPNHNMRTIGVKQDIDPVEGMLVTIFASPRITGVQAVAGTQSAEQIEELYHENNSAAMMLFSLLFVFTLGVFFIPKRKNADANT